jgi:FkbM family methyltransferase
MSRKRSSGPLPKEAPPRVSVGHLRKLTGFQHLFPREHREYMRGMRARGINPRVIYDVGSNVLHWTREAKAVWPNAAYFAFEAMQEVAPIYDEERIRYHLGVLSDRDGKEVTFYVSPEHPSGNSYYRENPEVNRGAEEHFLGSDARPMETATLDAVVRANGWPTPDLIKMDVQGAELDVLKGARRCLRTCKDLILELQTVEYNRGAPLRDEVIAYMEAVGFVLRGGPFRDGGYDGDYHFAAER